MLLAQSTQMLGYGWAGIFQKFLVDSPYMWCPSNLVRVSLFRALHEIEIRPRGGVTRLRFFLIVLMSSFAYYIVPNYLFPSITALSLMCWIWKDSITAQQIGSGLNGLGLGSFALDWSTAAIFLGSPLATPGFAIINVMASFFIVAYIVIPIAYWTNAYEARRFLLVSPDVFDSNGSSYNVSKVLNYTTFEFNQQGYDGYTKINFEYLLCLLLWSELCNIGSYVLSAGLDAGVAFVAIFSYFTLQVKDIDGVKWWGSGIYEHCPLDHCPTAPAIKSKAALFSIDLPYIC